MPELPDVETFRAQTQRGLAGASVSQVVVSDPASLEDATGAAVERRLKGRRLLGADRHGKYLFLNFGEETVIVMHFGPAGALRCLPAGEEQPSYVRFAIAFSNGIGLAYINRRRIGRVRLIDSTASFIEHARLGPDAMDNEFRFPQFAARLAGRNRPIKLLLMDQSRLSGIGNTYSDEILFQARIHPAIPARDLDANRSLRLYDCMRSVLGTAIDLDPTTDDFRERLPADFLMPHRYPGGHCPRCGTELRRIVLGGHTATYCPHCQEQKAGT
jgi:formamidopyrimidine-DNA glycosylase